MGIGQGTLVNPITTAQPAHPANPLNGPAIPSLSFGINNAFSQTTEDNAANKGGVSGNTQQTVEHIRIYYPRGVDALNDVAFKIRKQLLPLAKRVDVYSLGSIFAAPINYFRYTPGRYQLAIGYQPTVDKGMIDNVLKDLKTLNMEVEEEDIEVRPTGADISVFVRILPSG